MKPKEKPSGPRALSEPQSQTTLLNSSLPPPSTSCRRFLPASDRSCRRPPAAGATIANLLLPSRRRPAPLFCLRPAPLTTLAISDAVRCFPSFVCRRCVVEQIEHVFWNCEVAVAIWDTVFKWLQVSRVTIFHPGELFTWIDHYRISANRRKVIEAVVCTTLWVIWRYRNDVVHDSGKMKKDIRKKMVQGVKAGVVAHEGSQKG
ncbi:hypothetical protein LXL04_004504 [Taraxacum kok-saghyz]